jgi:hypothetical protein
MSPSQGINVVIIPSAHYRSNRYSQANTPIQNPAIPSSNAILGNLQTAKLVLCVDIHTSVIKHKIGLALFQCSKYTFFQYFHVFFVATSIPKTNVIGRMSF